MAPCGIKWFPWRVAIRRPAILGCIFDSIRKSILSAGRFRKGLHCRRSSRAARSKSFIQIHPTMSVIMPILASAASGEYPFDRDAKVTWRWQPFWVCPTRLFCPLDRKMKVTFPIGWEYVFEVTSSNICACDWMEIFYLTIFQALPSQPG